MRIHLANVLDAENQKNLENYQNKFCLNLIETGAMDTDDSHTQKHVYLPATDDRAWG
jgi:hypothetical protein